MNDIHDTLMKIEAIIFASHQPVSIAQMKNIFEKNTQKQKYGNS